MRDMGESEHTERRMKRGPGRPTLGAEARRGHMIAVKVTPVERAVLEERAATAGLDVGVYVRVMGLGRRVVGVVPEVNRGAWGELARTTANVNQIAAHLNSGGRFDERGTPRVAQALDAVRGELERLRVVLIGPFDDEDDES